MMSGGVVEVRVVGNLDVHDRSCPKLRFVANAADLAVRHIPDHAFDVTKLRRAQRYGLDRSRRLPDIDNIADSELILGEHEDAR